MLSWLKCMRIIAVVTVFAYSIPYAADKTAVANSHAPKSNTANETEILLWIKSTENIDNTAKQIDHSLKLSQNATEVDQYKSIQLLLAKAEYFKKHNIPGAGKLANAAEIQLNNISDTTTSSGALQYSVLLSDIYLIKDQNAKAIDTLVQCLKSYYPVIIENPRVKLSHIPDPARITLQKLGGLYKTEADNEIDIADKKKWISLASGCFISAACGYYDEHEHKPLPVPDELLAQISICRDTINILGGDLRLPEFIRKKLPDRNISLIYQAMAQQNYKTALKLIDKCKSSIEVDCCKLQAFAALNMNLEATTCAEQLAGKYKSNSEFIKALLKSAHMLKENKSKETSLQLYRQYASLVPDSPQAPLMLMKYAQYHMENNNTKKAISLYLEIARKYSSDINIASHCYMKSAQLLAMNKDYSQSIKTIEDFESLKSNIQEIPPEISDIYQNASLLAAKCALQSSNQKEISDDIKKTKAAYAEKRLELLLKTTPATSKIYPQIALLSVHAAEQARLSDHAFKHYKIQLNTPDITNKTKSSTARRLMKFFIKSNRNDLLYKLTTLVSDSNLPNKTTFTLGGISTLLEKSQGEQALELCTDLSKQKEMSKSEVLALLNIMDHNAFVPYMKSILPAKLSFIEMHMADFKESTPELYNKLLYSAALTANASSNAEKTYQFLNENLSSKAPYKYYECKLLRAEIAMKLDRFSESEKDCREIMLMSTKPDITIKAVYLLAQLYKRQKQWSQLVTTASFCLPMVNSKSKNIAEVKACVELLCDSLNQLGKKEELKQALETYLQAYPDSDRHNEFSKLLNTIK